MRERNNYKSPYQSIPKTAIRPTPILYRSIKECP